VARIALGESLGFHKKWEDFMAKLSAHGRELLRISKEKDIPLGTHTILKDGTDLGETSTTWERVTRVYMSDGKILQKLDVRFKPSTFEPKGKFYSYGWKITAKMKPGHSVYDLVAKNVALIREGKSSYVIENGGPAPVIISQKRVLAAVERDDNTGFCKACGQEQDGCEPDARNYRCESCGAMEVYGAEEMLVAS
jgi:hypothetical protein